ncbi:hypothetical protein RclHR1_15090001 [Rhizophagus clarus]|nr:hypothetical protein RclHR1_15090001 [Rhizophagus clarus]
MPTNFNNKHNKIRYICCKCYEKHGDHIYIKPGRGFKTLHCNETSNHLNDVTTSLELMANWILQVAHNNNVKFQEKILNAITPALQQLNSGFVLQKSTDNSLQSENSSSSTSETLKLPSPFAIKLIFRLYDINLNKNQLNFKNYGNELAESLLTNRQNLSNNKVLLENPQSLDEYQNAIPVELYHFFEGMVKRLLIN